MHHDKNGWRGQIDVHPTVSSPSEHHDMNITAVHRLEQVNGLVLDEGKEFQVIRPGETTWDLFVRKRIRVGAWSTFMFFCTILATSSIIMNPAKLYSSQEDTPKDIIEKLLGDMDSRRVQNFGICKDCARRSKACSQCKWLNSQLSLEEIREIKVLSDNLRVLPDPKNQSTNIIMAHYPLNGDRAELYHPSKSNSSKLKAASASLCRKLKKKGLLLDFHEQILKSIREEHMVILTPDEQKIALSRVHAFSGINYQLKPSSKSHAVRVVTNSSSYHVSGSLNSHTPKGLNLMGNLKAIFTAVRLGAYCLLLDLARAYRSVFTTAETNDLRLMWWIRSVEEAETDLEGSLCILKLLRLTFGDQPSASILELALRTIIAPQCKTDLGRKMLLENRYVDDILISHFNRDELFAAMIDVEEALGRFGFKIKHICSPQLVWHAQRGELNTDFSTTDGCFEAEQSTENVFHHNYHYRSDELSLNIVLNVHGKSRGMYIGPALESTDLDSWQVTKQALARLTGQCFKVSGSFIDPLLISFKIFFSKACKLIEAWQKPIEDVEFVEELKSFLRVIQHEYTLLRMWPRCILPLGNTVRSIHCHSDGATFASSYAFYLITAPKGHPTGWEGTSSWQVDSDSKIKNHSVPSNESLGLLEGVEALAAFIHGHHEVLFRGLGSEECIRVSFGIDSSCLGSSLNPKLLHKNVMIRNISVRVHELCADLSDLYNTDISFYHNRGSANVADMNSKIPASLNPIDLINSDIWREGLPAFRDPQFPHPDRVFLHIRDGAVVDYRQPIVDKEDMAIRFCSCHGELCTGTTVCSCSACNRDINFQIPWIMLASDLNTEKDENEPVDVSGINILKFIPDLSSETYKNLIKRHNLTRAVRFVARFLPSVLPTKVQAALGYNRELLLQHSRNLKQARTAEVLDESAELNPLILKVGFLALVKASNKIFPPKPKEVRQIVNGICIRLTRYDNLAMQAIFGTNVLPVVSTKDGNFLKRLYDKNHTQFIMKCKDLIETSHKTLSQTLQASKHGCCAMDSNNIRKLFKTFHDNCPECLKKNFETKAGKFSVEIGNPRLLSLMGEASPCFHTISIDLTGCFHVKNFCGARGRKPTHPMYGLFMVDLLTRASHIEMMDKPTAPHVVGALATFSNKFRMPSVAVCDEGPQLKTLDANPIWAGLQQSGIKIQPVGARHQFLNFAERSWADFRMLLESMRTDINLSIYRQNDTLTELLQKFALIANVLNTAPVLVKHQDRDEQLVMRQSILKPFLSAEILDAYMSNFIAGVSGKGDLLLSAVLGYNEAIKTNFKNLILTYLQEKGMQYQDIRRGTNQQDCGTTLKPVINDVVLYKDSAERVRFAIVTDLLANNVVEIKVMKRGKPEHIKCHIRLLKLCYRSTNPDCHLNMM